MPSLNETTDPAAEVPALLAGPLVRRLEARRLVLWLATSRPLAGQIHIFGEGDETPRQSETLTACTTSLRIGAAAWVHLIDLQLADALAEGEVFGYDLEVETPTGAQRLAKVAPQLLYPGERCPTVVHRATLTRILHGSCRKPHFPGADAMACMDAALLESPGEAEQRPSLLMLTGDQIYADDVAGPTLRAIHGVMALLGLWGETWSGTSVARTEDLFASDRNYYRRQSLLPRTHENRELRDMVFGGVRKPIFTAASARNHLITASEVLAMYLLAWSPALWRLVDLAPPLLRPRDLRRYTRERDKIQGYVDGMPLVARALAHVPTYMIFDDHDVTDDWNLNRGWEEAAYGHPFSRRIIGNALLAYSVCQAWGNDPDAISPLIEGAVRPWLEAAANRDRTEAAARDTHDATIDGVLRWNQWHYQLPTSPKLIVLDTRTHRWRSESSPVRPSGLMDWESLSELQQQLIHERAVVMVSAAPIFGVKLIEAVQRVFTWFGFPLLVDAENWMAHRGAANVILNIFQHARTPAQFVILSGDVHYSFVYDISLRHGKSSPEITQITCSGVRNRFPAVLLPTFDRLNRLLYGRFSPLNWLTKRRRMSVRTRHARGRGGRSLVNRSALGDVRLDEAGHVVEVALLADNGDVVRFGDPRE